MWPGIRSGDYVSCLSRLRAKATCKKRGFDDVVRNRSSCSKSPRWRRLVTPGVVFFVAFGMRLGFVVWHGPVFSPDSEDYFILARNLATQHIFSLDSAAPYTPSIRRAPLYPGFLALAGWFGASSPIAVTAIQAVLDAGVAVVILVLGGGSNIGMTRWAKTAAAMYAVHPGAIVASATLLSETLFTGLLAFSVWALESGLRRNRLGLVAVSGFGLGLAILCRPIALLLPVALVSVLFVVRAVRRRVIIAIVLLGVTVLVVCPWVVRSSILTQRFVAVQAFGAVNLYVATRLDWDQKNEVELWPRVARELGIADARTPEEMSSVDRRALTQAATNIVSHPSGYVTSRVKIFPFLFLTSFDKFTGINEGFGTVIARHDFRRGAVKISFLVVFSLVPILLAFVGLSYARRDPGAYVSAAVWIYTIIVHAPMWFENRFWWPAVPFVLQTAVIGAVRLEHLRCGNKLISSRLC